jgi:hypothetical protein
MGIFAQELASILADHQHQDLGIWQGQGPRGDPVWHPLRRLGISSPIIQRLKHAAANDRAIATMTLTDLARLGEMLCLTPDELWRLRAAWLAEGVAIHLARRAAPSSREAARRVTRGIFLALLKDGAALERLL